MVGFVLGRVVGRPGFGVLSAAVLLGCTGESSPSAVTVGSMVDPGTPEWVPTGGPTPIPVTGELLVESVAIGQPGRMVVDGDRLWINDKSGDPFLHLVDLRTGSVVRSRGRAGEGPGDFGALVSLSVRPADSAAIWAFDLRYQRLTRVLAPGDEVTPRILHVSSPFGRFHHLHWLDTHRLLGVGGSDSSRFQVLDSLGQVVAHYPGPLVGDTSVPLRTRENVSTGVKVCPSPTGDRFASIVFFAGRLDIVDLREGVVRRAQTPIKADGVFAADSLGRWSMPHPRTFYVDCVATARMIYAIYAGRRVEDFPSGMNMHGRFLHIFDWDGTLIRIFALDRPYINIAVDGDSILYLSARDAPTVRRYRIAPTSDPTPLQ